MFLHLNKPFLTFGWHHHGTTDMLTLYRLSQVL